jgi:hypothetical protein
MDASILNDIDLDKFYLKFDQTRCCMLRRAKKYPYSFICKSHGKQKVDVR